MSKSIDFKQVEKELNRLVASNLACLFDLYGHNVTQDQVLQNFGKGFGQNAVIIVNGNTTET
jgi:hypothetical protein